MLRVAGTNSACMEETCSLPPWAMLQAQISLMSLVMLTMKPQLLLMLMPLSLAHL